MERSEGHPRAGIVAGSQLNSWALPAALTTASQEDVPIRSGRKWGKCPMLRRLHGCTIGP